MPRRQKYDRNDIISDWKTGKYTERALAAKHKVSPATIHNIVTGIEKTLEPLISKQIEINQTVANLSEQEISKFKQEVDERTKQLMFFQGAHMLTARIAVMKLEADNTDASYQDLNAAANAITKAQEGVLGKTPDVAVQVNNNNVASSISIDQFREVVRQVQDEY